MLVNEHPTLTAEAIAPRSRRGAPDQRPKHRVVVLTSLARTLPTRRSRRYLMASQPTETHGPAREPCPFACGHIRVPRTSRPGHPRQPTLGRHEHTLCRRSRRLRAPRLGRTPRAPRRSRVVVPCSVHLPGLSGTTRVSRAGTPSVESRTWRVPTTEQVWHPSFAFGAGPSSHYTGSRDTSEA